MDLYMCKDNDYRYEFVYECFIEYFFWIFRYCNTFFMAQGANKQTHHLMENDFHRLTIRRPLLVPCLFVCKLLQTFQRPKIRRRLSARNRRERKDR